MKYIVKKDKAARLNFVSRELNMLPFKAIYYNCTIPLAVRLKAKNKLFHLNTSLGYKVRIKNRCYQTGRSGSVERFTHTSRMRFRELASIGNLVGIKKSSW